MIDGENKYEDVFSVLHTPEVKTQIPNQTYNSSKLQAQLLYGAKIWERSKEVCGSRI